MTYMIHHYFLKKKTRIYVAFEFKYKLGMTSIIQDFLYQAQQFFLKSFTKQ